MSVRSTTSSTFRLDGLAQRRIDRVIVEAGDRCQERVLRPRLGDGRDSQDALPVGRHGGDPAGEDVPQGRGHGRTSAGATRWLVDPPKGKVVVAREQLLGEEGIALRPRVDPLGETPIGSTAEDRGELLTLGIEIERSQLDPLDLAIPADLGESHQKWMPRARGPRSGTSRRA